MQRLPIIRCQAHKITVMATKTTVRFFSIFVVSFLLFLFSGCVKDAVKGTRTYTIMTPILKARSEVMADINGNPTQSVEAAGKIYIKDNFIYLNEVDKGIHIIDNSNPSSPKQVAFLDIPGNLDVAVRGNTLYADMYGDLLALDISDPKKATVTKELKNFFWNRIYYSTPLADSVIVGWTKRDTTVSVDFVEPVFGCATCGGDFVAFANAAQSVAKSNGTSGSLASMVLMNDYLYALREPHSVGIVNISEASSPRLDTTFSAGFDLETVYPLENKLFLGSMSGMYMYDLTNPLVPVKLGEFSHGRACDPVVTDGEYAYVTLHAGTNCGGEANELNVIDIKNLMSPVLVKSYELTKPTGLCKDGDLLFICDGDSGVRLFDASNAAALQQIKQIPVQDPYDVIATGDHLMVVAKDGLYQFDYSNTNDIRQLSFYAIKR